jgi:alkylhydroperoxidase family enzyme
MTTVASYSSLFHPGACIVNFRSIAAIGLLGLGLALPARADGPSPVPLTRDDVKQALENSKRAVPRLPLPPATEEEKAKAAEEAKARAAAEAARGEAPRNRGFGIVNNGRMRALYLSDYSTNGSGGPAGFSRDPDPAMTLEAPFRTMMFWIVSRGNNCTYCLGHQESGLGSRGVAEDVIAALDGDWSEFDGAERAAFRFAKKLSFEPHAIADADIAALRKHYSDSQITEIILAVAGFNAMNRWTGPLRITQEERHVFLKPTSAKYAGKASTIAPIASGAPDGKGTAAPASRSRPALESPAEVEAALRAARERTPRLKLADESAAKALLNGTIGDAAPAQWMRLLAIFPKAGPGRIASHLAAEQKGTLDARAKAIIAYVAARNDRAWYALGHARERLKALGFDDAQVRALDEPEKLESPADREIAKFARKITVDPALADDEDFARLRKLFDDKKVAEIVYQITEAAGFDRITEAAGLQLER